MLSSVNNQQSHLVFGMWKNEKHKMSQAKFSILLHQFCKLSQRPCIKPLPLKFICDTCTRSIFPFLWLRNKINSPRPCHFLALSTLFNFLPTLFSSQAFFHVPPIYVSFDLFSIATIHSNQNYCLFIHLRNERLEFDVKSLQYSSICRRHVCVEYKSSQSTTAQEYQRHHNTHQAILCRNATLCDSTRCDWLRLQQTCMYYII